ncbi:hypothetical protein Malapachy_1517 [Malassezia pachydermatis]|uniref:Uncharacterized protein n=1 Tax=Malassezia pachydermatis TaxID=77020 RepID=A0A0M8MRS4_9BASI|nr:hypothetical protein Malapachy_1517 [Malassezia pachydermatis]KOS13024.1 hypothetical protein Malapachy_1517 [Malassezia pachydermatis]
MVSVMATTDVSTSTTTALAVRQQCGEGGMILQGIEHAITALLPMLQPLLMAAGIGEILPFVQIALQVIEALHLFC